MPEQLATKSPQPKTWYVYMVRCQDDSLYTGITVDATRRLRQHNGELVNGSRYTRHRRPVVLVYLEPCPDRGSASRREYKLKQMTKSGKEALIIAANSQCPESASCGK